MDFIITRIVDGELLFWCGKYGWGSRTFVQIYRTWQRAERAIKRQQEMGRWLDNMPKYSTLDELWDKVDDYWQPLDASDEFWQQAISEAVPDPEGGAE